MVIPDFVREIIRIQALLFISHASPTGQVTPKQLSRFLGVPSETCEEVIGDLASDGFVDPLPELRLPTESPLYLTPLGNGFVRWVRERAKEPEA